MAQAHEPGAVGAQVALQAVEDPALDVERALQAVLALLQRRDRSGEVRDPPAVVLRLGLQLALLGLDAGEPAGEVAERGRRPQRRARCAGGEQQAGRGGLRDRSSSAGHCEV
jgi:hypothetical protein